MMMRTLGLLAVLAMAACGDSTSLTSSGSGGPIGPTPMLIAGTWTFTLDVSNAAIGSCKVNATATLNQTGNEFTGSVQGAQVCTIAIEIASDDESRAEQPYGAVVTGGRISGALITFASQECSFAGSGSGSPVTQLAGSVTCALSIYGAQYSFAGTWRATR